MVSISWPSVASLLVFQRANGQELGSATGFVVERDSRHYLITNWHVVTGRNPRTGANIHPTGAWPDEIMAIQNAAGMLGQWIPKSQQLHDSKGNPLWLEHPTHGRQVDVVALPLTDSAGIDLHAYDPWSTGADVVMGVSRSLSIIGFPFGLTGGGAFAIWVQGTVATEPEIDFDDLPSFLIDSRTRQGQSGSPVIFYSDGGMVPMADGSAAMFGGEVWKFIGVYSGRINEESDLEIVWKASVIPEIIGAA